MPATETDTPKKGRTTIKALEARFDAYVAEQAARQNSGPVATPTPPAPQPTQQPPPAQPQTQAAPTPPAPASGVTTETSMLVKNVAIILVSLGVIGVLAYKFGAMELLNMVLLVGLPLLMVFYAAGWMSKATLRIIYGGQLKERVESMMAQARATAMAEQQPTAS